MSTFSLSIGKGETLASELGPQMVHFWHNERICECFATSLRLFAVALLLSVQQCLCCLPHTRGVAIFSPIPPRQQGREYKELMSPVKSFLLPTS